ncbi:uncharacterized protein CELE_C18H9.1 [Caenorhabditis elegans]|uniref:Uncharacterized protein n=1 Tax=Caenorhabditis elegans TaxID=6239 RepID=Q09481_CAEEL|nr:Uncharacterized protein CELE_C18H9.1 [Caenorhabditis elegans]CCD65262.1 Uncharacterized protein CELE_C18H9.1 [Caenorhabditis elegans]|eukprot:NP_495363.2 Uncharacterized protein CELE_C18H9.1 [Caenorhabditis elegans]
MQLSIIVLLVLPISSYSFIVGGCIGPKSVLERFLNDKQKTELRKMVHNKFDGSNAEQVLEESNRYVYGHVTEEQWHSIVPELAEYQAKKHECSVYAQLLPKPLYQQLLKSVLRASEMGASKYDVKRLVDDYVNRLAKNGVLPDVIDKEPILPRVTLPESEITSQSYRKYPKKPKAIGKVGSTGGNRNGMGAIHPTLISYPEEQRKTNSRVKNNRSNYHIGNIGNIGGNIGNGQKMNRNKNGGRNQGGNHPDNMGIPMFPIARPTPYDLAEYIERGLNTGRSNHRTPQNFRRYPEHECDYYAGPCATSF